MQLFVTDGEGRRYEIEVETDQIDEPTMFGRGETWFQHRVRVVSAIDDFILDSNDQTDPQELMNRIFDKAHEKIEDWLEGK